MKPIKHFLALFCVGLLLNFMMALALWPWATDEDFTHLPPAGTDRFMTLLYYVIMTFTSIGDGDITAVSNRARVAVSLFVLAVYAGLVTLVMSHW